MQIGFEDPNNHRVLEVTAEYDAGTRYAAPCVTLTFRGRHSDFDRRTEECSLGVHFAREDLARRFAEAFAAAINAVSEEVA